MLAVAVASTIVLAAFTANKTATTTIQFGGGLTIDVSNITQKGDSSTTEYYWNAKVDGKAVTNYTSIDKANTNIEFQPISLNVNSESSVKEAYVITYVDIKVDNTAQTLTPENGWFSLGNGYYLLGTDTTTATKLTTAQVPFVTAYTVTATDALAGKDVVATFKTWAIDANAESALSTLKTNAGL